MTPFVLLLIVGLLFAGCATLPRCVSECYEWRHGCCAAGQGCEDTPPFPIMQFDGTCLERLTAVHTDQGECPNGDAALSLQQGRRVL